MALQVIEGGAGRIEQSDRGMVTIAEYLANYQSGSVDALYDLGVALSTGSHGCIVDMIEAHKWFNIAASLGHEEAAWARADVADEMTAREIHEAQRLARSWLIADQRRVA